jgi:Golgi nucleoside diphosphatase
VALALDPLIEFAKTELAAFADEWHSYPIFLKATAGMRELPLEARERIMTQVRQYLSSNTSCPFLFQHNEQARVIAGEEEAAYAWTGGLPVCALFHASASHIPPPPRAGRAR